MPTDVQRCPSSSNPSSSPIATNSTTIPRELVPTIHNPPELILLSHPYRTSSPFPYTKHLQAPPTSPNPYSTAIQSPHTSIAELSLQNTNVPILQPISSSVFDPNKLVTVVVRTLQTLRHRLLSAQHSRSSWYGSASGMVRKGHIARGAKYRRFGPRLDGCWYYGILGLCDK